MAAEFIVFPADAPRRPDAQQAKEQRVTVLTGESLVDLGVHLDGVGGCGNLVRNAGALGASVEEVYNY
jgi:hypothetical protein